MKKKLTIAQRDELLDKVIGDKIITHNHLFQPIADWAKRNTRKGFFEISLSHRNNTKRPPKNTRGY